jgi:hypothetical protein
VIHKDTVAVTCPVRLRQNNLIVADAANFFFPPNARFLTLTEVRLPDKNNRSAGNIDIVLVQLDEKDQVVDFGALEVQAVYVSGNVTKAFKHYMDNPSAHYNMEWPRNGYPTPDYLSSSRKRLAPQLIYKGGILNEWGKKTAVAVHSAFFDQLPPLIDVSPSVAEIAWLIYDLILDPVTNRYKMERKAIRHTKFKDALNTITTSEPGDIEDFINTLKVRIKKGNLTGTPPESEVPPEVEPPLNLLDNRTDSYHVTEGDE